MTYIIYTFLIPFVDADLTVLSTTYSSDGPIIRGLAKELQFSTTLEFTSGTYDIIQNAANNFEVNTALKSLASFQFIPLRC